jgi:hypothetical protein
VKAGTFSNISVLGQVEPFIAMQYSTGCSTGPCLTSPASGNSREVTTWVAPGIGVIKYQGPFYVPGAIVTYELRKMPVMSQ